MQKYRHIIFDADHTLIEFSKDERRALKASIADMPLVKAGNGLSTADMPLSDIPPAEGQVTARLQAYSTRNWTQLGLDEVNDPVIQQRYHALTYEHVHALIKYAAQECALQDAEAAERIFFQTLCLPAHPCKGALELIKALAEGYTLSVATNGLATMQRARLKEFIPYFRHLFISEEMGIIKPAEEFGKIMLNTLQAKAEECLFVGDSLTSDIALANKMGMDAVWVNPEGRPIPEDVKIKGQIKTLDELYKYL